MTMLDRSTSRLVATDSGPWHHEGNRVQSAARLLIVLDGFVSLSALAGGTYLLAYPSSAMPTRYLSGTWFESWRWPGIALLVLLGILPALVALATLRRWRIAPFGNVCTGVGLVAWVCLEAAWVVVSAPLQIPLGVIGIAIALLGMHEWRRQYESQVDVGSMVDLSPNVS